MRYLHINEVNMHVPHEADDDVINKILTRVKTITSLSSWQQRVNEDHKQLREENERLRQRIAAQERTIGALWMSQACAPGPPPPARLIEAWYTASDKDIFVAVDLNGQRWDVAVEGEPRTPNPVREAQDWRRLQAVFREVTEQVGEIKRLEEQ